MMSTPRSIGYWRKVNRRLRNAREEETFVNLIEVETERFVNSISHELGECGEGFENPPELNVPHKNAPLRRNTSVRL